MKRYFKKIRGLLLYETEMFYIGVFGTIITIFIIYICMVVFAKTIFAAGNGTYIPNDENPDLYYSMPYDTQN